MIGITERGDPAFDTSWFPWVSSGKPAILVTKRPHVIHSQLKGMDSNVIVHATITGFGGTVVEPNVPDSSIAIVGYHNLVKTLGSDRVVLRIDPIIPTEKGIQTAKSILEQKRDTRVRISFLDNYKHVKERFEEQEIDQLPWDFHAPLELRKRIWEELGKPEVCGEPGFTCTGCVSKRDCEILGVDPDDSKYKQRRDCACLGNKKELLNSKGQCFHRCLYCYWK